MSRPPEQDRPARASDRVLAALVGAALLVPLVVLPRTFVFPYVASKVWFVRPLAWAAAAFLVSAFLLRDRRLPRPGPVAWSLLAFLVSAALSTTFGVDRDRGVWDTGERMLGLVTLAAAGVLFAAAVRAGRDAAAWRRMFRVAAAAAPLVAIAASIEAARNEIPGERAGATLGGPAFLGAFGVHATFLGVLLWRMRVSAIDRVLAGLCTAAGAVTIVLSEARAAVLGLALGGAYLVVRTLVDGAPQTRRRIVAGLAGLLAVVSMAWVFRDSDVLRSLPLTRRLGSFTLSDGTIETRRLAWEVAVQAARDRPLLGWGPNAYAHAFSAHYRPEFLRYGPEETFFDDAHGVLAATLAEQGLLGIATLTLLFLAPFTALRRARASGRFAAPVCAAAGAWIVAHAGNLLVSFEDVSSLVAAAVVLAFCERAGAPAAAAGEEAQRPVRGLAWRVAATAAVAVVFAAWTFVADVRPAVANARARDATDRLTSDPASAVERMRASAALESPHADTHAAVFAWAVQTTIPVLLRSGRAAEADLVGGAAFALVEQTSRERGPDVVRSLLLAGLADRTPALRAAEDVQDRVRAALEAALAAAPRRQDVRFALAGLELRNGRFREAEEWTRSVVRDDPDGSRGWARLAAVYRSAGRVDDARRIVRQARERGIWFVPEDQPLIAGLEE